MKTDKREQLRQVLGRIQGAHHCIIDNNVRVMMSDIADAITMIGEAMIDGDPIANVTSAIACYKCGTLASDVIRFEVVDGETKALCRSCDSSILQAPGSTEQRSLDENGDFVEPEMP